MNSPAENAPETQEPIYWFALLERAIRCNDAAAALEAKARLDRLGVHVEYERRGTREVSHAR